MNKKELLNLVDILNLPKEEYFILSGGALLMAGLRESTNDLDIGITKRGFEILKEKYSLKLTDKNIPKYEITDKIECMLVEKLDSDITYIDNYPCQSLISVYNFKKRINREKDRADILAIEKYLNIK